MMREWISTSTFVPPSLALDPNPNWLACLLAELLPISFAVQRDESAMRTIVRVADSWEIAFDDEELAGSTNPVALIAARCNERISDIAAFRAAMEREPIDSAGLLG